MRDLRSPTGVKFCVQFYGGREEVTASAILSQ